ncbi:hypothetical protein [Streptomyces sp. NPDC056227]
MVNIGRLGQAASTIDLDAGTLAFEEGARAARRPRSHQAHGEIVLTVP